MANPRKTARDRRIEQEIIVDCYGPDEQAMGWYCYLDGQLAVPFTARCTIKRAISPLKVGDEVKVIGMPPESECEHEMFVTIRWLKEDLAVPLAQLKPLRADRATRQAVEDWLYWVDRGYSF
jgi:hypothetical protein